MKSEAIELSDVQTFIVIESCKDALRLYREGKEESSTTPLFNEKDREYLLFHIEKLSHCHPIHWTSKKARHTHIMAIALRTQMNSRETILEKFEQIWYTKWVSSLIGSAHRRCLNRLMNTAGINRKELDYAVTENQTIDEKIRAIGILCKTLLYSLKKEIENYTEEALEAILQSLEDNTK